MAKLTYGPPPENGEVLYVWRMRKRAKWVPILSRRIGTGYECVAIPLQVHLSVLCACCRPKRGMWASFKKSPGKRDQFYFHFYFSGLGKILVEKYLSEHSLVQVRIQEKMKYEKTPQ